jgi:hypothetical protein
MAVEEALRSVTFEADASIGIYTGVPGMPGSLTPNSGKQFRFVKITGAGDQDARVGLCTGAANEIPSGVLQNKPQTVGGDATVGFSGRSRVESGGAVAIGPVKIDATGRVVTGVAGTDVIVGIATSSANAAGQLVSVQLKLGL